MADASRYGWLLRRQRGLGGSDVAGILGLHPQVTPLAVYVSKVQAIDDGGNASTLWGTRKEPLVLDALAERLGVPVIRPDVERMPLIHPERDWQRCTPDGFVGDDGLAEAKTAEARKRREWGREGTDEIPPHYLVQCQWNLGVTGRAVCWVPVLIDSFDFRVYRVERCDRLIDSLVNRAGEWWQRHVLRATPPPPIRAADNALMAKAWPTTTGTVAVAPELEQTLITLREWRKSKRLAEQAIEQLEALIKAQIGTAAALRAGEMMATWKPRADSDAFDLARARADLEQLRRTSPDDPQAEMLTRLLADYTGTRDGGRVLLVRDRRDGEL